MPKSQRDKRLDNIEVELTPKEWAIRLADERRAHSSENDFLKDMAKRTYRESPYVKPFYALILQARKRHPGEKRQDICIQQRLDRKLRQEFHALKTLINDANETIKIKSETNRLKSRAQAGQLQNLILQDAFARTVEKTAIWLEQHETARAVEAEERHLIIEELAEFTIAGEPRLRLSSLIQDWADDMAMLATETLAFKAAVQFVQEQYFDGHPILSRDIEGALETTIRMILDVIATFNEYLKTRANLLGRSGNEKERSEDEIVPIKCGEQEVSLFTIDVEAIRDRPSKMMLVDRIVAGWVTGAKDKAVADILEETGEHQAFVWKRFTEKVEGKSGLS